MSKTIEGVPETIAREDYLRLIKSVGLDPEALHALTFGAEQITATVFATTPEGEFIHEPTDDDEFAIKSHDIVIPVTDEGGVS